MSQVNVQCVYCEQWFDSSLTKCPNPKCLSNPKGMPNRTFASRSEQRRYEAQQPTLPRTPRANDAVSDPRSNALFECAQQLEREGQEMLELLTDAISGRWGKLGYGQWLTRAQVLIKKIEEKSK